MHSDGLLLVGLECWIVELDVLRVGPVVGIGIGIVGRSVGHVKNLLMICLYHSHA